MSLALYIRKLEKDLTIARDDLAMSVGRGSCSSHEDYLRQVGKGDGLDEALELVQSALKQMNEDDEE